MATNRNPMSVGFGTGCLPQWPSHRVAKVCCTWGGENFDCRSVRSLNPADRFGRFETSHRKTAAMEPWQGGPIQTPWSEPRRMRWLGYKPTQQSPNYCNPPVLRRAPTNQAAPPLPPPIVGPLPGLNLFPPHQDSPWLPAHSRCARRCSLVGTRAPKTSRRPPRRAAFEPSRYPQRPLELNLELKRFGGVTQRPLLEVGVEGFDPGFRVGVEGVCWREPPGVEGIWRPSKGETILVW